MNVNKDIKIVALKNSRGTYVELLNVGASIRSIITRDKKGELQKINLSCDNLNDYKNNEFYLGATIGPVANRISNARFKLGSNLYSLEKNDGGNCNHSGSSGFHHRLFKVESNGDNQIVFSLKLLDMEDGFPGDRDIIVAYSLNDQDEIRIDYLAQSSKDTPMSITNHTYFNLNPKDDGEQQILQIFAAKMLESDNDFLTTGKIVNIKNTAFDFSKPIRICNRIATIENRPLKGFNDYFVVNNNDHAILYGEQTGLSIKVESSYGGFIFYTGDALPKPYAGVCLEPHNYVDAVNVKIFPSTILKKNEKYQHFIKYKLLR